MVYSPSPLCAVRSLHAIYRQFFALRGKDQDIVDRSPDREEGGACNTVPLRTRIAKTTLLAERSIYLDTTPIRWRPNSARPSTRPGLQLQAVGLPCASMAARLLI